MLLSFKKVSSLFLLSTVFALSAYSINFSAAQDGGNRSGAGGISDNGSLSLKDEDFFTEVEPRITTRLKTYSGTTTTPAGLPVKVTALGVNKFRMDTVDSKGLTVSVTTEYNPAINMTLVTDNYTGVQSLASGRFVTANGSLYWSDSAVPAPAVIADNVAFDDSFVPNTNQSGNSIVAAGYPFAATARQSEERVFFVGGDTATAKKLTDVSAVQESANVHLKPRIQIRWDDNAVPAPAVVAETAAFGDSFVTAQSQNLRGFPENYQVAETGRLSGNFMIDDDAYDYNLSSDRMASLYAVNSLVGANSSAFVIGDVLPTTTTTGLPATVTALGEDVFGITAVDSTGQMVALVADYDAVANRTRVTVRNTGAQYVVPGPLLTVNDTVDLSSLDGI